MSSGTVFWCKKENEEVYKFLEIVIELVIPSPTDPIRKFLVDDQLPCNVISGIIIQHHCEIIPAPTYYYEVGLIDLVNKLRWVLKLVSSRSYDVIRTACQVKSFQYPINTGLRDVILLRICDVPYDLS